MNYIAYISSNIPRALASNIKSLKPECLECKFLCHQVIQNWYLYQLPHPWSFKRCSIPEERTKTQASRSMSKQLLKKLKTGEKVTEGILNMD